MYQTTFYYFMKGLFGEPQSGQGCTLLPQASSLTLRFTESGLVDFKVPRCVHCWSRDVKKIGTVKKRILKEGVDRESHLCQHYKCNHCDKFSSPILTNVFLFDAYKEGMQIMKDLESTLSRWESEISNEEILIKRIYQSVQEIYCKHLNLPRGKNVIYNKCELTDILIQNIIDCQSSEMSSNLLNLPGRGEKSPSSDAILMYLGRNSKIDIRQNIREIFDAVNGRAKDIGVYNEPVPVAIDFHLEPYYGKHRQNTIRTSKAKSHAGTQYNFKYATADITVGDSHLTVFGQHISALDKKADIFKEVVEYTKDHLMIKYLMADREFFTVEILKYLEPNIPYIMPAIKNKAIFKEAEKHFHNGAYVFDHVLGKSAGEDHQIKIKIFIIPNEKFDVTKKISKENPEFYIFATNMPINKADIDSESVKHSDPKRYEGYLRSELAEMYTARWGIETDYRVYAHEFRPRTTSNKFQIRYLFFFSGEIMRDIWILTTRQLQPLIQEVLPKKILRAKIFKYLLRKAIDMNRLHRFISGIKQQVMLAMGRLKLIGTNISYEL